ncbi:MBL fold metallo-hydrolase [Paenibacillus tuaregi]|uniref:MBL fold metallo-hydrolase n=1 Tax=Paenibacillus tuaregi TaxID=1816681 RepID=UPI000838C15E|nr:MBL fold metallo-hydrolase [Paenibacillus tuaregi]
MGLRIQMLGTGGAFAKKYYNNNALLYTGSHTLLIDCGVTAPASLYQLGKTWADIDAVLITHIHADHVGGLEEYAFQMKYIYQRKPVLYIAESLVGPIWEYTLKGGLSQDGIERLEDAFEVRPLREGTTTTIDEALQVEIMKTPHIEGKNSYSLYLNGEIFYSADMRFQPELLEDLVTRRSCRKILHEVQLIGTGYVHTTLEELLSLPPEIQSRISLMHYDDVIEEFIGRTGSMEFLRQHEVYDL